MDYRYQRRSIKKRNKARKFLEIMLIIFFIFTSLSIGGITILGIKYMPVYEEIKSNAEEKIASIHAGTFKDKEETVIYDRHGNIIEEVAVNDYYYINFEDIQPKIIEAVIAIEDERFYEHKGYDLKAILRAGIELIKNKGEIKQGGSTITQQLVKLQFLTLDKTFERKIEEILIASELEKIYSKEEILEFYLNNVNYGNGAYGIETASITYFNKPSSELTLSEIAFLTAIPNNPSHYNPVKNMENTLKRRDLILYKMNELGYILDEEYEEAKNQEIVLNMPEKEPLKETYEISFALSSATKILMEYEGFEFQYWFDSEEKRQAYNERFNEKFVEINQRIRNGGYQIYTTIDMEKQKLLQEKIDKYLANYQEIDSKTGLYTLQGASVTIDNETGDVLAIVGGRSQEDINNTFNRAFLSYRQPGSTAKPILAYIPAIEQRGYLASTIVNDKPIENGPENVNRSYLGKMEVREAVERSINTIPYRILIDLKPENVIPYMIKMKFSNLSPLDNQASIAIGGFTYGASPLEMASAYSTIARNGEYIQTTGINKIIDITENVIYENYHETKRVYDSGASYLMTDILKGVLTENHATGKGLSLDRVASAGKTGTTNGNKDVWFAGYSPYYTTVVWFGYDMPKELPFRSYYAGEMWHEYMNEIHKDLPEKDFEMPDTIRYMYWNPQDGKVSEQKEGNNWKKELVPDIYINYLMKKEEEERKRLEEERRMREEQRRLEEQRKAEERRRILESHGITEEEELEREQYAKSLLRALSYYHIYELEDYDRIIKDAEEVRYAIERVVIQEKYDELYAKYLAQIQRIEQEKQIIENRIKEEEKQKQLELEKMQSEKYHDLSNPTNNNDESESKDEIKEPDSKTEDQSNEENIPIPDEAENDDLDELEENIK